MRPRSRTPSPVVVLDSGIYVSAAISGQGPTAELIEAAAGGDVVIVVSPHLLDEFSGVLRRDKFRRWISLEDAATFVDGIVLLARPHPDPAPAVSAICRDPKDDYLILLAEDVQAHLLVSGDKDLLELERPGLIVRTAREALNDLASEHP